MYLKAMTLAVVAAVTMGCATGKELCRPSDNARVIAVQTMLSRETLDAGILCWYLAPVEVAAVSLRSTPAERAESRRRIIAKWRDTK